MKWHVLTIVIAGLATSCAPDVRPGLVEPCDQLCIADPTPHCVSVDPTCSSSNQCSSGLTCARIDPGNVCATKADLSSQCRPAPFDHLALQREFDVGGMTISVDPGPVVSWQSPKGAETVACALFSCNPSFTSIGFTPTEKRELKKIDNFAQCVLLFAATTPSPSQFSLIDDNMYRDPSRCEVQVAGTRIITELTVGCWAYDTTSLIAASELVHVSGTLVSQLSILPHDTTCDVDGTSCYDPDIDRFGVCLDHECKARCLTSADCTTADDTPPRGLCEWSCHELPGEAMGACIHNSP